MHMPLEARARPPRFLQPRQVLRQHHAQCLLTLRAVVKDHDAARTGVSLQPLQDLRGT